MRKREMGGTTKLVPMGKRKVERGGRMEKGEGGRRHTV